MESDPHSGRPATSRTPKNVECVRAAINKNWRLTVQELEEALGIPQIIVSEILTEDLGKKRDGKICFVGPVTRAERISCRSYTGLA